MNLHEYQSKKLLEDFGLPTAKSVVAFSVKEVSELLSELSGKEFVVKVQVHAGGRGKVGGVKITNKKDEIIEFAKDWLGKKFVNHQTGDEGKPVVEASPEHEISQIYFNFAEKIKSTYL